MKASGEYPALSSTIGRCHSTLDTATRKRMKRKFELCFVMAKQSIPLENMQSHSLTNVYVIIIYIHVCIIILCESNEQKKAITNLVRENYEYMYVRP